MLMYAQRQILTLGWWYSEALWPASEGSSGGVMQYGGGPRRIQAAATSTYPDDQHVMRRRSC